MPIFGEKEMAMADERPKRVKSELYQLILQGDVDGFNAQRERDEPCDMRGLDFRGQDLRKMDVRGIDFSGSYFRQADLRGLNLSECRLEGASIHGAKVSGVEFPRELSPAEIRMSLDFGTRMRYD
jgi:uncharacterized protein YjbI with pentapeptide repeats